VCELVGDDREPLVDQIGGARWIATAPGAASPPDVYSAAIRARHSSRTRGVPIDTSDTTPCAEVAVARRVLRALHRRGSITQFAWFAYCTTVSVVAPSQPSGHAIFIGGGGLHVGTGSPGCFGFGHSTRAIA